MSRIVSLNARTRHDALASEDVEVVLVLITHPDLDAPVRLSTDPTVRLSIEPLTFGTRSTWKTVDGSPFYFVLASAILPGDREAAPQEATLVIDPVTDEIAKALRSTTSPARVDMAVVLSGSPDLVEVEVLDVQLVTADIDSGAITLSIRREMVEGESWPSGRMTKSRFPGLHR